MKLAGHTAIIGAGIFVVYCKSLYVSSPSLSGVPRTNYNRATGLTVVRDGI